MEGESQDFRRRERPLGQLASVNTAPQTRAHTPSAAGVFSKNMHSERVWMKNRPSSPPPDSTDLYIKPLLAYFLSLPQKEV